MSDDNRYIRRDNPELARQILSESPIFIRPSLLVLVGSYEAAAFLGKACYWSDHTKDPEGWFYKGAEDWKAELYLSRTSLQNARKICKTLGVIEEKLQGSPARLYYRIAWRTLTVVLRGDVQLSLPVEDYVKLFRIRLSYMSRAANARVAKTRDVPIDQRVDLAAVLLKHGLSCHICSQAIGYGPGVLAECLTFDCVNEVEFVPAHVACLNPSVCNGITNSVCNGLTNKIVMPKQTIYKEHKNTTLDINIYGDESKTPPEREHVIAYMKHIGALLPADEADEFIAHHNTRNWVPSGQRVKMKDWHSACVTWKKNAQRYGDKTARFLRDGENRVTSNGCTDKPTTFDYKGKADV